MSGRLRASRRRRLHVDVSDALGASVKHLAERFYRGAVSDVVAAAFGAFSWMLDQKSQGRKVIAVDPDAVPERYSEPVLPGVDDAIAGDRWTWLVERAHPWQRQLWIKGRRMRAAQLVGQMYSNDWSADEAARQFDLPLNAVLEARRYVEGNLELIDAETIEEQRIARGMPTVHPPEPVRADPR